MSRWMPAAFILEQRSSHPANPTDACKNHSAGREPYRATQHAEKTTRSSLCEEPSGRERQTSSLPLRNALSKSSSPDLSGHFGLLHASSIASRLEETGQSDGATVLGRAVHRQRAPEAAGLHARLQFLLVEHGHSKLEETLAITWPQPDDEGGVDPYGASAVDGETCKPPGIGSKDKLRQDGRQGQSEKPAATERTPPAVEVSVMRLALPCVGLQDVARVLGEQGHISTDEQPPEAGGVDKVCVVPLSCALLTPELEQEASCNEWSEQATQTTSICSYHHVGNTFPLC
mmetsp:Transcript_96858/g.202378  ORF Transcript_96858/g.202378 Transcript_96858/m.202378 type:complete len:288 (+) Transcript_96858:206-1069(+)